MHNLPGNSGLSSVEHAPQLLSSPVSVSQSFCHSAGNLKYFSSPLLRQSYN